MFILKIARKMHKKTTTTCFGKLKGANGFSGAIFGVSKMKFYLWFHKNWERGCIEKTKLQIFAENLPNNAKFLLPQKPQQKSTISVNCGKPLQRFCGFFSQLTSISQGYVNFYCNFSGFLDFNHNSLRFLNFFCCKFLHVLKAMWPMS